MIAFIGLGAMGAPMAKNLILSGKTVKGFDANENALTALKKMGGMPCRSAQEACSESQTLILMVVNIEQARQILFEQGALDALPIHATICLMSTCPPGSVEALAQQVISSGRRFVDCPVSGGVVGATDGKLTIMAACDVLTFDHIRPLFDVLGNRVFHVGDKPGQGAMCKTINQLLCGLHLAVAAEAFSLAKKSELNLELLLEIMSGSSASSWMLNDRGHRMLSHAPEVTSAIDIFVKDLGIVVEAGRESKAALPLTTLAYQMFLSASGRGEGKLDDSQVVRSFDLLNGLP
jgi:L-threonate 2-dehydrogenase